MNKYLHIAILSAVLLVGLGFGSVANAQVPPVDIEDPGFRLIICDGPRVPPSVGTAEFYAKFQQDNGHAYRVCDFVGLMEQAQYLINVMIVVGVLAAILGFVYAGYLYITGVPGNISKAKEIFPKIGIGFILMLAAWFIVYQILEWLTGNTNYLSGAGM